MDAISAGTDSRGGTDVQLLFGKKSKHVIFVNTPDGPGRVMGMKKDTYAVKLTKSRGRPRHYKADQVSEIENELVKEGAAAVAKIAAVSTMGETAGLAAGISAKKGVGFLYRWYTKSKTGY